MKIIWKKTGDELEFIPSHYEFSKYYITSFNGEFSLQHSDLNVDVLNNFESNLALVNDILIKFKLQPLELIGNLYTQNSINRLHENWVKMHKNNPNLSLLFSKLNADFKRRLDDINLGIHEIESMFRFTYQCYGLHVQQIDNIFGHEILDFGKFDILIQYDNLGRSSFNKWRFDDDNIIDIDTNDYNKVGGRFVVDLTGKNYKLQLPEDYIQYCNHRNLIPLPDMLPLGNFLDRDQAKKLFLRNTQVESNPIFLSL